MADAFPVSGNIDPTSFPHLLVDLHRRGATGSLKVNGPVHPKALYFRGGRILFGSSNDPRDQLGAILIESGKITREQLDEVNAKVGPGNPLAKVLAESGFVNQRELGDAARVKVERILSDVISWESGSFEFEDGVLPKGAVDLKLSTTRLLLAAIQRVGERSFALRHLGGDTSVVLEPTPDSEALLADVRAEVWPLLERLDGQRTLQDAIALTRLDEFEAAKTACAMLFMGIARAQEGAETDELDLAQEARSGLAGEAEPEPVVVSSEQPAVPFPIIDAEPADAEPVEAAASETVQFVPEPEAESEPPIPVPILEPEAAPLPNLDPTGFAFVEPEEPPPAEPPPPPLAPEPFVSPPPEPTVLLPPEPAPPSFEPEPPRPSRDAEPPSSTFERVPPPPSQFDTLPGDQPAYTPSAAPFPDPSADHSAGSPSPDSSSPGSSARPTKEDLAALDALLNPSAMTGATERPAGRPRSDTWEPQFRTGTTAPRRAPVGRSASPSRAPLVGGAVVLVLAVVAAGYYFLFGGSPEPTPTTAPTTAPTTEPAPNLSAPATLVPPPAATPTPAAQPTATPTTAAPAPTPVPTPPPAAASPTRAQAPPPPTGEPRALLRQGSLDAAARGFAASLAGGPPGRYGIQALVACSPETVMKAVRSVGDDALFILPVNYQGRDCHRICWGVYPDRAAAEAAARSFPSYFRENRIRPRIQPLPDLLP